MITLTSGVDLVVISRVARILSNHGSKFLDRVFSPDEVLYSRHRPPSSLHASRQRKRCRKPWGLECACYHPPASDGSMSRP